MLFLNIFFIDPTILSYCNHMAQGNTPIASISILLSIFLFNSEFLAKWFFIIKAFLNYIS